MLDYKALSCSLLFSGCAPNVWMLNKLQERSSNATISELAWWEIILLQHLLGVFTCLLFSVSS